MVKSQKINYIFGLGQKENMMKKAKEIGLMSSIQTLLIMLLLLPTNIYTMEPNEYVKKCSKIRARQQHKLSLSCDFDELTDGFCTSDATKNSHQKIAYYTEKLQRMKFNVEDRHDTLFKGIKTEFDMDTKKWEDALGIIDRVKKYEKEHQHLPLPGVKHDKTMPHCTKQMLKSLLKENGINPKRINFKHLNASSTTFCSPIPSWKIIDTDLIFTGEVNPGTIDIHRSSSLKQQEAHCLIAVEIIKQACSINLNALSAFSQPLFNVSYDVIDGSLPRKKYIINMFHHASLLVALQSQKKAALIEKYCFKIFSTDSSLSENLHHYTFCAKIKRYWDTLKWLKRYGVSKKLTLPKELADKSDTTDKNEEK